MPQIEDFSTEQIHAELATRGWSKKHDDEGGVYFDGEIVEGDGFRLEPTWNITDGMVVFVDNPRPLTLAQLQELHDKIPAVLNNCK